MEKKIKLAIIGPDTYPIPAIKGGAIETGVTNILNLNEQEELLDITVYTVEDDELKKATEKYRCCKFVQVSRSYITLPHFFVFKVLNRLFNYPWTPKSAYMYRINKMLEKEQYDAIQFNTGSVEVAALSDKVKSKVKYVVSSDYLSMQTAGIENILKHVDMFASNEYIIDRIMSMLNVQKKNTFITNAAIDTTLPSANYRMEKRQSLRTKHNLNDEDTVVIYVGRLSPEKGSLELIKAVKKVENCKLLIVGGANFNSNKQTPYVQQIREEANACNGRVIFTGYVKDHSEVVDYMYAADIACVPSVGNEAGSIALLEFRAAGLPTIISDQGGMKYHAAKLTQIAHYDDNYVSNLAGIIEKVADDKTFRETLAQDARVGLEKHSLDKKYEQYYRSITELLSLS